MGVRPGDGETIVLDQVTGTPTAKRSAEHDETGSQCKAQRMGLKKADNQCARDVEQGEPGLQVLEANRVAHESRNLDRRSDLGNAGCS